MLGVKSVVPASYGHHFQNIIESLCFQPYFYMPPTRGVIAFYAIKCDSPSNATADVPLNAFLATGQFGFYTNTKQVRFQIIFTWKTGPQTKLTLGCNNLAHKSEKLYIISSRSQSSMCRSSG